MSTNVPSDRRPTKAERKEQARLEREALQQRLASRKRRNALGVGLIAGGVAVAAAAFFLTPDEGGIPTPDALLQRAGRAATQAGCSEVQTTPPFDPADQDRQHVASTLGAGVYETLSLDQLYASIHSLEHGASIVWYDPNAPAERIAQLQEFFDRRLQDASVGQDRVIVAPYDFPDQANGLLPDGQQLALVAWHRLRSCADVDLAVAYDFTSQYSFPTSSGRDYLGEAPEPGGAL